MPNAIYLAELEKDDPMITDKQTRFRDVRLIEDARPALQVDGRDPLTAARYPMNNAVEVSRGVYDELVLTCENENGLARRLAESLMDTRVLLYCRCEDLAGYERTYCGIFTFSQMTRLRFFTPARWQIIFTQTSAARPATAYDSDFPAE